jgi:hypothetical protein
MSSDRILKYYDDIESLRGQSKLSKLVGELKRLNAFVMKHQSESITEPAKNRLVQCITDCYAHTSQIDSPECKCVLVDLMSTYCAIQEGKIATSKAKQKFVKYLDDLNGEKNEESSTGRKEGLTNTRIKGLLMDCSDESIAVSDANDPSELFESVIVDDIDLRKTLQRKWNEEDGEDEILVELDITSGNAKIVALII